MTFAHPTTRAPTDKFQLILGGAVRAFAQHGFSRTQMADIATEAGVALGTLYRYAPSKEELFHMALLHAAGAGEAEIAATRWNGGLFDIVSTFIEGLQLPQQVAEIETIADAAPEPAIALLGGLYDRLGQIHAALRILNQSSREWPDLAALFAEHARLPALKAIERRLRMLSVRATNPQIADPAATSRLILEIITWFAMHRPYTPDAPELTDEQARATVLDFVGAALRPFDPGTALASEGKRP